jgi:hypothetical protein
MTTTEMMATVVVMVVMTAVNRRGVPTPIGELSY